MDMKVAIELPLGSCGAWSIDRIVVTEAQARLNKVRAYAGGTPGKYLPAGSHARLLNDGEAVLVENPLHIESCSALTSRVRGRILLNGLGLGLGLRAILESGAAFESVVVIEQNPDVVSLVSPAFEHDDRIAILHKAPLDFLAENSTRFDVVWHDFWDPRSSVDRLAVEGAFSTVATWQGTRLS